MNGLNRQGSKAVLLNLAYRAEIHQSYLSQVFRAKELKPRLKQRHLEKKFCSFY